ncbi:MAG: cytidine deaminase [Saccharofermentans sp.]|nr:cytidine deaminase [Saccharofermentans sp.]
MDEELIRSALEVLDNSYAPYSHFHVAAAVLTGSGKVYTGVNVENASYPAGICAECNAVAKAVSCGDRKIRAVAIVGRDSQGNSNGYISPCGICRQVLREFSVPQELKIIMAKGIDDYKEMTLEELLPASFGPESLG